MTVALLSVQSVAAPARTVARVPLTLRDQSPHSALISWPVNSPEPLPTIIVLGGFETGEKSLDLLPQDVKAIYAVVDYPYKEPEQRGFVRDLGQISEIKRAVRRTDLAIDALIEKLIQDPRVDRKRLTVVGASFGAPFAITAAIRHPELTGLIMIHAFGRVDAAIKQQLVNEWGKWSRPLAWLAGYVAWKILAYPAPEEEVRKLRPQQSALLIYSDEDEQLPAESVASILDGIQESAAKKTIIKNQGGHLGPGKHATMAEVLNLSLRWLRDRDQL